MLKPEASVHFGPYVVEDLVVYFQNYVKADVVGNFSGPKRDFSKMDKKYKSFYFLCLTTSQFFFLVKELVFEKIEFFIFFFLLENVDF